MRSTALLLAPFLLAPSLLACTDDAVEPPATLPEDIHEEAVAPDDLVTTPAERTTYLAIRDPRDCAAPECGGWLVQKAGAHVAQRPLHVDELDVDALALTDAARATLLADLDAAPAFTRVTVALRGVIHAGTAAGEPGFVLAATAAWAGPPIADPGYLHRGDWFAFVDDQREVVAQRLGDAAAWSVVQVPAPPADVRAIDTIVVGRRDEEILDVSYRMVRVR